MDALIDFSPSDNSDESSESEFFESNDSLWDSDFDKEVKKCLPLDVHTAASIGYVDCIQSFIDKKDECLHSKNQGGWTPLMYASYYGHTEVVELLLENGINPNETNHRGCTAIMLAAMCGNMNVVQLLLKYDSLIEMRDLTDWTALFHATYSGHQNVVQLLLQNGANVNSVERNRGFTPFILAAAEGAEIIVHTFLQHNANVNQKCYSGDTARSLALVNGFTRIVSLIDNFNLCSQQSIVPNLQDGPTAVARMMNQCRLANSNDLDKNLLGLKCTNADDTKGSTETTAGFKNSVFSHPQDLATLLEKLGLSKYFSVFEEQDVDLHVFLTLSDSDLKEVGIKLLGPRRKMTSAISRWHSNAPLHSGPDAAYADKLEVEMQDMGIRLHKALLQLNQDIDKLEQERQLRAIVETCLMEERSLISEALIILQQSHLCLEMMRNCCNQLRSSKSHCRCSSGTSEDEHSSFATNIDPLLQIEVLIFKLTEIINVALDKFKTISVNTTQIEDLEEKR